MGITHSSLNVYVQCANCESLQKQTKNHERILLIIKHEKQKLNIKPNKPEKLENVMFFLFYSSSTSVLLFEDNICTLWRASSHNDSKQIKCIEVEKTRRRALKAYASS